MALLFATSAASPAGTIVYTSTQVLASFTPTNYAGQSVQTSDMGLMTSDGTRWLVVGTPPIPPGAAMLGYKTNVFTVFPVLADITYTYTPPIPITRVYSGGGLSGNVPPSTSYSTAANGQLQLQYPSGGPVNAASNITTINAYNGQQLPLNLGYLAPLLGSQGFYVEFAATHSVNNADVYFAFFLEPQEHNTIQSDAPAGGPAGNAGYPYERWYEFDVNESGSGSPAGGRGAFHGWQGFYRYNLTFTVAPSGTWTGGTLTVAWPGESFPWTITLSTGQQIPCTLTNGSTTASCQSTVITGTPTTAAAVGYGASPQIQNPSTAAIDYTVEHIIGLSYDPIGQQVAWWLDGVLQGSGSVSNMSSAETQAANSWHYFLRFVCQSHGSNVGYTVNLRYFSAWTP